MENKIILIVRPKKNSSVGQTVRLNRAAADVVEKLMNKTGMKAKEIVSEIIIQSNEFIEIVKEE